MLTITKGICLVALIALSVMTYAAEKTVNDGYWWSSSDRSFKLGYVTGYVAGMGEAGIKALAQCASLTTMLKDKYPDQNLFQKLCEDQDNFDGITMGQFVDGVEEFYK